MDHLLNWLWQGSVVALATSVILRLLTRARAEFRYVLCWIGLTIVLTLPVVPLLTAMDAPVLLEDPVADALSTSDVIFAVPNVWWTSTAMVLSAWAIWSGFHSIRILTALLALRHARLRCQPFPSRDESRLVRWNDVRELGRRTRLVLSTDVHAAAVLGCGSPVIAVAPALVDCLDREELDRIVVHEWAHVQRRDDLLNLGQLAVCALAGWHPAVWWLNRQLQIERESACDEATIALTGSVKGYAASLAKTAGLLPARRRMVPAVGALSSPGLRMRIIRILSYGRLVSRPWSAGSAATAALALLVLAVCVGGLRVIGLAALAAPFEAPPVLQATQTDRLAPTMSSGQSGSRNRRTKPPIPAQVAPGRITATKAAVNTQPPDLVTAPPDAVTHTADRSAPLPSTPTIGAVSSDGVPIVRGVTLGAPPPRPPVTDSAADTPWGAAADGGVALGRASQKAAVATAGFFSRLGKKIAGSF